LRGGRDEGFGGYHTLMWHRVERVLLVASPYDCFIMEEDGLFADRLYREYVELDLSHQPRFNQVSTPEEALDQLSRRRHDLVLVTGHGAGMSPTELVQEIKRRQPRLPVVMLTYDRGVAMSYAELGPPSGLEGVFLWTGDPRLLLAIVKLVEDRINVTRDTRKGGVRVIVLVEDNPAFYSAYLPILWLEVLNQTRSLMRGVINDSHRRYRARARPKVLLARNYEEASQLVQRFRETLLGVITDLCFPRDGRLDKNAGFTLIEQIRRDHPDVPILVQSSEVSDLAAATGRGVAIADKNDPVLLAELQEFLRDYLGFGAFVFRLPNGNAVDRAENIEEMLEVLERVPVDSISHHGHRNHFSNWLMARCEFPLAMQVRPRRLTDFGTDEEARSFLLRVFSEFVDARQRGQVTDFVRGGNPLHRDFSRIGGGSMGGKARGIAFAAATLARHPIHEHFPDVRLFVPRTKVICSDAFEDFSNRDNLWERALEAESDREVLRLFLEQPLDDELMADLESILTEVRYPLSVRSSSLSEDSASQPLAGLFRTTFLPNCARSDRARLEQLSKAVRYVYASTFLEAPRALMDAEGIRVEAEKMAVAIQRLVGSRHGERFYSDFAGVIQSRDFYPLRKNRPEDGVVTVALGMGRTVVEGGKALRFCPKRPRVLPQMSNPELALASSQVDFWALEMRPRWHPGTNLKRYELSVAEADGTLEAVGATCSLADDRIYDTIYRPGIRIVNFAQVLKYGRLPLAPLALELLDVFERGLGTAVELEFAVALDGVKDKPELAILQVRPQVSSRPMEDLDIDDLGEHEELVMAGPAIGNGEWLGIHDVVYVDPESFDPSRTREMATAIGRCNAVLRRAERNYLLMGPGRFGTGDRWLGIPVTWDQVSAVKVVVEVSTPRRRIDPSQGAHFFHNVTALHIGYFAIELGRSEQILDLDWLAAQPAVFDEQGVRHVHLERALVVRVDGRQGRGLVVR